MPHQSGQARRHGPRTGTHGSALAPRPALTSRKAGTGSRFPFNSSDSTASASTAPLTSRIVSAPSSTSPGCGSLLQPGSDVDRVPRRQPLLGPGHDLTRIHTDPCLHPEFRQRFAHLERGTHRPQCVILVRHRNPKHHHHRVTDELLHRPTMRLDDPAHPLEIPGQQRPQRLRIRRLPQRRRPGHVTEHNRHDLPLLTPPTNQRRSTERAEGKLTRQLLATRRTSRHRTSLRRARHPSASSPPRHDRACRDPRIGITSSSLFILASTPPEISPRKDDRPPVIPVRVTLRSVFGSLS